MPFDQASLTAAAGIDPWALTEKLASGDPAQIQTLATAFWSAAGDADDARASQSRADEYVAEGYTVDGSSPVDFQAQARSLQSSPEELTQIARILDSVAADLDRGTDAAQLELEGLVGDVNAVIAAYNSFLSGLGRQLPPEDRDAVEAGYVADAVAAVQARGAVISGLVVDYEVALIGYTKSLSDLGYVALEELDEGPNALAAELDNEDGLHAGGPSTQLPLDADQLRRLKQAAEAAGLPAVDMKPLLAQYYAVLAADRAGIDLATWDPGLGVDGNPGTINAVYDYYGDLFAQHPELQWLGFANMVGPTFAAGFQDLDMLRDLAREVGDRIEELPEPLREALPSEVRALAALADVGDGELAWFETQFLAMQKHIFMDQGGMHEAYLADGTDGIDTMATAGLVDRKTQQAWSGIESGDPSRIAAATVQFSDREQNQIIDKQYKQMRDHHGLVGEGFTYGMSVIGSASVPGTRTPGEYSPLDFGGSVTFPGLLVDTTLSAEVTTPLPDFNVADRESRWDYITHDALPRYQELIAQDPDTVSRIVASPIDQRIAEQRILVRLPEITEDLVTNWDVDADVDVHGLPWPR
ncbi:hypothetical protein GB931_12625 [Modestobacter sp. I12A-02628]|uniref:Predicted hydrolase N-terminal domain-containing protein n=1 Tax=Goekera deserti TaxID=2497753 RepID=A0A7K3WBZ3_9ACTN|nr:hypothetical protein [Goekera deserti]MPQ98749.1 hypothetical protein [Goekera deserti]NDI49312.1 hypothetical protein [Goekera deserti]NEL53053.1 hypothetical protein [Goekera deserti]